MLDSELIRIATENAVKRLADAPRYAQLRNAAFVLGTQGHYKEVRCSVKCVQNMISQCKMGVLSINVCFILLSLSIPSPSYSVITLT